MKQLPRLKYISLCNCRRLKALPELVQLEIVKLSGCMNLQSLFKTSHAEQDWGRWRLRELWADDCNNIQSISDQLGRFTKLSYVDLSSNDFETLPSSIRDLSSLRTLCLNKCKKLKSIEGFPLCLKYLYAHGCESLETISFPLNHSIKHLDLSHCFCLKEEEHLVAQFLTEGQNEEDSPRFACFPGTEVPSYFDTIGTGKAYTTGLPWPTPKLDSSYHSTEEEEEEGGKSDHLIIIRGGSEMANNVTSWREALTQIACIAGKDSAAWSLHEKKKFRGAELGPHEVKVFAQDTSWFGPGSRTVYEVKCLDTDDSRKIFNQLAFEGGLPPSECYDKLSIRASRLAEGLPCAIKAYGLFF
ncbi:hypothetical protein Bca52824_083157 [Brassica carinata]|uniref:Uncharacterized protein n=1 Tax=Brassica carinata TaxID=52824 RepID=A0A8X7TTK8_BRACI|nr:hypothetical protein Bca52824_083157 [Brassica carinata]